MPEFVRVRHPDIEGEALVPARALRQMDPKWRRVDEGDQPPPEETSPEGDQQSKDGE